MELSAPGLETALIRLEPLSESHRSAVQQSGAMADLWANLPLIASGTSLESYLEYTLRMADFGTGQGLAVILKSNRSLAGLAAFHSPSRLHRRIAMGHTWVAPACRGLGLAQHILFLMLKRSLEWRARRLEWAFSTEKVDAVAALERIGARKEGVLRAHSRFADGSWADLVVLSLIGDEIRDAMHQIGERIGEVPAVSSA